MQCFGEPERASQITNLNDVFFSQNSDLLRVLIFRAVRGIRRVQALQNICTCFARFLYSTKQSWIIFIQSTLSEANTISTWTNCPSLRCLQLIESLHIEKEKKKVFNCPS